MGQACQTALSRARTGSVGTAQILILPGKQDPIVKNDPKLAKKVSGKIGDFTQENRGGGLLSLASWSASEKTARISSA
jgi:hypothetical protein